VATGAVGPVVDGVGRGVGGFVASVTSVVSSPEPTPPPAITDAPSIVGPDEPYTNGDTVDVTVNVPPGIAGAEGYSVRLWATVADQEPQVVADEPVGPTASVILAGVELERGRNDFQASVVGPGGESELSPVVTWVLDQSKPKITITAPRDGASTGRDAITVKGKTQGRSSVRLQNDQTGATTTIEAGRDGLWEAVVAVAAGINTITVTVIDPAGNPNTETLTIRKGSGRLLASLTGTAYRFTASKLPRRVSFTVQVTGPDGRPLGGAEALFTVTVPGLEAIVSPTLTTSGSGVATFTTSIPKGAMAGSGLASVLVTTDRHGETTDRQVLTVK